MEKEVGQEVMIMGKLLLMSWGTLMQISLDGADVRGIKPSFVRDKVTFANKGGRMKKSDNDKNIFSISSYF